MNKHASVRKDMGEAAEIAWFAPICDGDDRYLGERDERYKSSWEHTSRIAITAEEQGFRNILLPSSYQVGQDTWTFASALATLTTRINLLTAIRCGEVHPPMLARAIATLDHILKGRLTINIISSDLPGHKESSGLRYGRSAEVIEILKQAWTSDRIDFEGEFYNFHLDASPAKPYQQNGGPLLYFGGYSDAGQELCAKHCDVYLMWPETTPRIEALIEQMKSKAARHGRNLHFGLRIHVIVRETEEEARSAARELVSRLDDHIGMGIRERAQDAKSKGVQRQTELREAADKEGYIEDHLWAGIGRARSGCGVAIVGDPDQVYRKIKAFMDLGVRAFILSGYPHYESCLLFGNLVMPRLKTISLPHLLGRVPDAIPASPLGTAKRF